MVKEFKIEDKIKITDYINDNILVGMTGKICDLSTNAQQIGIRFDKNIYGHDCRGHCRNGYGWYVSKSKFEVVEPKSVSEDKIIITTDGTTVYAKQYNSKGLVKTATAKCHKDDTFDFIVGAKLAFARLVGEPAVQPTDKPTVKERLKRPEPKYKVGDKIKVVKNILFDIPSKNTYIDGVYTITGVYPTQYSMDIAYSIGEMYVVYEAEIEPAPAYYNGKVVCVKSADKTLLTEGKIYEIKDGLFTYNNGISDKYFERYPITSLEELNSQLMSKFIKLLE